MAEDDRERLAAAETAARQAPTIRVVVEMLPTGEIRTQSTARSPVVTLGLLEFAKAALIREAAGQPSSPIVTARGIPS